MFEQSFKGVFKAEFLTRLNRILLQFAKLQKLSVTSLFHLIKYARKIRFILNNSNGIKTNQGYSVDTMGSVEYPWL